MLTVEQATARILSAVPAMPAERVSLDRALGRILAEDLDSPLNIPPWDNSGIDGYAVIAADLAGGGPVRLPVLETIGAGSIPTHVVRRGTCSRIMTGAPMPEGADAVVMVEETDGGAEVVELRAGARPGQNVRPRGDDVREGARVLSRGRALGAAELGMISSIGRPSVMVAQRPRVAVLSTGDEVVEAGHPRGPGQIYSSNTHSLCGLVEEAGAEALHCGIAPDSREGLEEALERCARADLILTTGGVSVGEFDFVKDVFEGLDFWRVSMQPGKPLAFGTVRGRPCFGLPGNPVSCMVGFHLFVRPFLRTMMGDPRPFPPTFPAVLDKRVGHRPGRTLYSRVRLRAEGGTLFAEPRHASSGALTSMVEADGLAVIPIDAGDAEAGDVVEVMVLRWGFLNRG